MNVVSKTFKECQAFYPFYLSEHQNTYSRTLHVAASAVALASASGFVFTKKPKFIAAAFVGSYALAWTGHAVFERNTPATFKHPVKSFICDWFMFKDVLTGRLSLTHASLDHPKLKV